MALSRLRSAGLLWSRWVAPPSPAAPAQLLSLCRRLSRAAVLSRASQPEQEEAALEELAEGKKMSKAMRAYVERAARHEEFMKKQEFEFAVGKRHLANMMGADPESFSQEDIDEAIEYLFPTGIFDKKARPRMRPPSEVFPQQKEAQFEESGRPHHSLFYTLYPNFYQTLHDLADKVAYLYKLEDKNHALGRQPDPALKLNLHGSEWVAHPELNLLLVEKLNEYQYQEFVRALNRLVDHPLAYLHKDFVFKFRKQQKASAASDAVPELLFDAAGRPYAEAVGYRKKAVAEVTVWGRGSGRVTVNGMPLIRYFCRGPSARTGDQEVAQVMFPLQVAGVLDSVDVEARVSHHGQQNVDWLDHGRPGAVAEAPSARAGAIRHAVSLALRSFVDPQMQETLRIAGLLQRDIRERERKKVGKHGARRGRTWKKR